ncbi:hypothetical protein HK105_206851 [Polyrhizophydium stewartii]|uniref:RNA polymerase II subunit B1 CTD phosphatase RPAP2 homolog n=1 Tax=Polyrhizophydium stewartii TaxID=2732419 RepID=A0ABR4N2F0_9FUNG
MLKPDTGHAFDAARPAAGEAQAPAAAGSAAQKPSTGKPGRRRRAAPAGDAAAAKPSPKLKERQKAVLKSAKARKELEDLVFEHQQALFEGAASLESLAETCRLFTPEAYRAVVLEREAERLCGYPACDRRLNAKPITARFHISLSERRVFDITDQKAFCSAECMQASQFLVQQLSEDPVYMRDLGAPTQFELVPPRTKMSDFIKLRQRTVQEHTNAAESPDRSMRKHIYDYIDSLVVSMPPVLDSDALPIVERNVDVDSHTGPGADDPKKSIAAGEHQLIEGFTPKSVYERRPMVPKKRRPKTEPAQPKPLEKSTPPTAANPRKLRSWKSADALTESPKPKSALSSKKSLDSIGRSIERVLRFSEPLEIGPTGSTLQPPPPAPAAAEPPTPSDQTASKKKRKKKKKNRKKGLGNGDVAVLSSSDAEPSSTPSTDPIAALPPSQARPQVDTAPAAASPEFRAKRHAKPHVEVPAAETPTSATQSDTLKLHAPDAKASKSGTASTQATESRPGGSERSQPLSQQAATTQLAVPAQTSRQGGEGHSDGLDDDDDDGASLLGSTDDDSENELWLKPSKTMNLPGLSLFGRVWNIFGFIVTAETKQMVKTALSSEEPLERKPAALLGGPELRTQREIFSLKLLKTFRLIRRKHHLGLELEHDLLCISETLALGQFTTVLPDAEMWTVCLVLIFAMSVGIKPSESEWRPREKEWAGLLQPVGLQFWHILELAALLD